MKDRYTRVLKGHIAIASARVSRRAPPAPSSTASRAPPLWDAGLDFDHGTGHGVGSYLSVHEGPQRISKLGTTPLEPGMILSNEPGYYKAGAFGIRIENLVVVEAADIPGAERPMLGFETLTLAPIDKRPIDRSLLTPRRSPGSTPITPGCARRSLPLVDAATRALAGDRHGAALDDETQRDDQATPITIVARSGSRVAAMPVTSAATVSAGPVARAVGAITATSTAAGIASKAALARPRSARRPASEDAGDPCAIGDRRPWPGSRRASSGRPHFGTDSSGAAR